MINEQSLDAKYWDERYDQHNDPWDLGKISTPLKEYIDQLTDKNIAILIPGCGNAYEAAYLLEKEFTNITLIDISALLVKAIEEKLYVYNGKQLHIICGDFFEHLGEYELIIEQTFFCALDPALREKYAATMYRLLKPGGKLVGLLFNREFKDGPPFGGNKMEYELLFRPKFTIEIMHDCYNSIAPRKGTELFFKVVKKIQHLDAV